MDAWDGWPFARLYLLLVAVAFLVVGGQVFLIHWRAAFRSKAMYGPVVMAPIIAAAGVAAAIATQPWPATWLIPTPGSAFASGPRVPRGLRLDRPA